MSGKKIFDPSSLQKRRRLAEHTATFGLLLVCVALIVPFFNPANLGMVSIFKWVYGSGALIFTIARVVAVNDPTDSTRLRRLRRLEFWAGIAFMIGAFFWFYEENHLSAFGPYVGVLAILRNTIMFSLVGAVIQLIASWMIVGQTRKEKEEKNGQSKNNTSK